MDFNGETNPLDKPWGGYDEGGSMESSLGQGEYGRGGNQYGQEETQFGQPEVQWVVGPFSRCKLRKG